LIRKEQQVKISVISIPELNPGKQNLKDSRLDEVDAITKAKKKTYIQVELVGQDAALEADAILVSAEAKADVVLQDLEFVESRASRAADEIEKALLEKMKAGLEKETLVFQLALTPDEKKLAATYSMLSTRPVAVAQPGDTEDLNALLLRAYKQAGYMSFFTTGEKETRAWSIHNGATAWEAAGVIHSDIQRGFIRAEIIPFADFISCGGEQKAKQANKQRLEQKEYVMQDADLANFRFSK
jgi:hypothetical protein